MVKGGVHETYCAAHTITNVAEIDYCLSGEADRWFAALLRAIKFGENSGMDRDTYRTEGAVSVQPLWIVAGLILTSHRRFRGSYSVNYHTTIFASLAA